MLNKTFDLLYISILLLIIGCGEDEIAPLPEVDESVVGFTTVELNAKKPIVRGGEAVLGNLIADSFALHARELGFDVDFAIANGGNIRFDSSKRTEGVYPAGNITRDNLSEMLPFSNTGIVVEMTGIELKSTLERSVHALPLPEGSSGNGAFAQLSADVQIVVNTSLQAQILDELNQVETIATEGQRVIQVLINGELLNLEQTYLVLIPSFAASGGDGYVMLGKIEADRKIDLSEPLVKALEAYLEVNSPVTPVIENRIIVD